MGRTSMDLPKPKQSLPEELRNYARPLMGTSGSNMAAAMIDAACVLEARQQRIEDLEGKVSALEVGREGERQRAEAA